MILHYEKIKRELDEKLQRDMDNGRQIARTFFASLDYKEGDEKRYGDEQVAVLKYSKYQYHYAELDSIKGCLLGGAIGDAFGFPVEFFDDCEIFKRYGENGITKLQLYNGVAHISDDTQMTLFTADGLLTAAKRFQNPTADDYVRCVYESYLDWLHTQGYAEEKQTDRAHSALLKVKELHCQRAPGRTCLLSLASGNCGTLTYKLNDSKGCGGLMRVAPVALYLSQRQDVSPKDVVMIGARTAAITHSHELGYIPAAYLTAFLFYILRGESLSAAYLLAKQRMENWFADKKGTKICLDLVKKARDLAMYEPDEDEESMGEIDDLEVIRSLGQGWVAEETLAIAIYCAFKYQNDFEKAMIAAANHSGDSDSTASVTGSILGAYWGLSRLPKHMVEPIELKGLMIELAKKMHLHKFDYETEEETE